MVRFDIRESNFSPYMLDSIVHLLIWDNEVLTKFYYIVDPDLFDGERKTMIDLCYRHFENYKECPGDYIDDIVQDYISRKPSKKLLGKYLDKLFDLQPNKDYVMATFGGFIQDIICRDSFDRASAFMQRGDRNKAQEELVEGFKKANSISSKEILDLLNVSGEQMLDDSVLEPNFRTYIDPYDEITGGFYRKELVLLFGPYSVGKSFLVIHFSKAAVIQGRKVLHITLETPEAEVKARYAASMTASRVKQYGNKNRKMFSPKFYDKKTEFLKKRGGCLWLIQGLGFTFNDLEALFNNIELTTNSVPDVLILDSPDQVEVNKYKDDLANEKWLQRRLLDFTKERNITTIETTQGQRRKSAGQVFRGHNVGGSIAKMQIPDTCLVINQSEEDYKNSRINLYLDRHRGAQKFINIEIKQDLDIGQPVVEARIVDKKKTKDEEALEINKKYEERKKKRETN